MRVPVDAMGVIKQTILSALSPWTQALTGDVNFELAVAAWFAVLVTIRYLTISVAQRAISRSKLRDELTSRPTVVPVMLHSLGHHVRRGYRLHPLIRIRRQHIRRSLRRYVLPFSSAYWLFDLVFYCWPKGDSLIAIHHVAILLCNYSVGDNAGRAAVEALNAPGCNVVLASVNGYLAEATTFLLYTRWCLAHTLNQQHWVYSANNLLLLGSWVCVRLLHAPYFLYFRIADTCAVNTSPLGLYTAMGFTTYGLMIAMSAIWLLQLTKNGIRAFLVLDKGSRNAGAVPSFGSRGGEAARSCSRARKASRSRTCTQKDRREPHLISAQA